MATDEPCPVIAEQSLYLKVNVRLA